MKLKFKRENDVLTIFQDGVSVEGITVSDMRHKGSNTSMIAAMVKDVLALTVSCPNWELEIEIPVAFENKVDKFIDA